MWTLVEEIVRAVAVSEVVILPWIPFRDALFHSFLINEHADRPQIPLEVSCLGVRARQFRGRDFCVILSRIRRTVPQPRLKLKE